jgi:hypothetical protein
MSRSTKFSLALDEIKRNMQSGKPALIEHRISIDGFSKKKKEFYRIWDGSRGLFFFGDSLDEAMSNFIKSLERIKINGK